MSEQIIFFIDLNKCIDCKTCEMACIDYHGITGIHRRKVVSFQKAVTEQKLYLSLSCNHCKNPVCIAICPENNYRKRRDGVVVLDSSNCKACMRCVQACPFEAPKINPKTNRADKCNLCVDRLDQELKPICVSNCPTGGLNIIKTRRSNKHLQHLRSLDFPIMTYTYPSIDIITRTEGRIFWREG
ncbi:4Fe-4S dicluster domain-containing protein [Bacillus sp. B15-48]|uniref:4Fe-4S dicluster domain-containing protein n=1 Tax=Bacillus sp. B15-48 TaxID=1548601 RepID=UPI00193FB6BE|nr:4Fe-4S dicluster domain-containing protein [Bacillus sp. B15-48]MBM4760842.1 oxidoreductase [Bacillus sp. B15-48]